VAPATAKDDEKRIISSRFYCVGGGTFGWVPLSLAVSLSIAVEWVSLRVVS